MPSVLHVAVVDGSPDDRALIQRALLGDPFRQYRCSAVGTAEQALALCRRAPIPEYGLGV